MVLGKLPVPGRPTIWIKVGQGPIVLAVGAGVAVTYCPQDKHSLNFRKSIIRPTLMFTSNWLNLCWGKNSTGSGGGGGVWTFFTFICPFSPLSPSLQERSDKD